MAKRLKDIVYRLLDKSRESAIQAVASYNLPGTPFRSGNYIVLMVIAWTALLHAIFHDQGTKPYYRKNKAGHFVRIDGEPKAWELSKCVKEYWEGKETPVTQNLEFFIKLRNKIEHRSMPELDPMIYGHCQALLLNYEDLLTQKFGNRYALNESLAFALQFSRNRKPEQLKAMRNQIRKEAEDIADFIDGFHLNLSSDIRQSLEYCFQVFLIPNVKNNPTSEALPIEFVKYDPDDPEQQEALEKFQVLIKDRHVPVANLGKYRPSGVVKEVKKAISPKYFSMHDHTQAWKHFEVRPPTDSETPEQCETKYCQWDKVNQTHIYTQDWVDLLIEKMANDDDYESIVGRPRPDYDSSN